MWTVHLTLVFRFFIFWRPRAALFLFIFPIFCRWGGCFALRYWNTPSRLAFIYPEHLEGIPFNFCIDDLSHFQIRFQILLCHKRIILDWNRDIIILKLLIIFIIIVKIIDLYFLSRRMLCLCDPRRLFTQTVIVTIMIEDVLVKLKSFGKSLILCFLTSLAIAIFRRASLSQRLHFVRLSTRNHILD